MGRFIYKWDVLDSSAVEGSSAVRVVESFEDFDKAYFESCQRNLESLKSKVNLLSFMVEEIQETFQYKKQSSMNTLRGC